MTSWTTEERAGLGNTAGYIQKLISAPLRKEREEGNFDLYYFIPDFGNKTKDLNKTLLFCSGGPGRVLKPHDHIWFKQLSLHGYKIVYFHLRGSGFSQLPESNSYDEYIRTDYAADDIEKIREDVFKENIKKPWDAVIGYSYGAVLAQQYASQYSEAVDKLILIGPISLDKFVGPADPTEVYDEYTREVKKIRISIIDKIYDLKIFREEGQLRLSETQKADIKERLFAVGEGIFEKIEKYFGSEQSVIDNYTIVSAKGSTGTSLLKGVELNHDLRFFQALRELHLYGRRTDNDGAVNQEAKLAQLGEVIARDLGHLGTIPSMDQPQDVAMITNAPRSKRVFEVMGVYDGINKRFIKEWLLNGSNDVKDVAKCVEQASGSAWKNIPEKIGVPRKTAANPIKPWSPADHKHNKSTLILKGSADPVTAAGQAESYLIRGVVGPQSIGVNFDGVGHEFILPGVNVESDDIHEILRGRNADPLNCLLYAFVEKDFDHFKEAAKPIWEELLAEQLPVSTAKPA